MYLKKDDENINYNIKLSTQTEYRVDEANENPLYVIGVKDKEETNVTVYDCDLRTPDGVQVVTDDRGWYLIATKEFKTDDIVFKNTVEIITNPTRLFIMKAGTRVKLIDNEEHFIHRDGYQEFLGFDVFMDHSCDPSVKQTYHSNTDYSVRATRMISPGDKITCDYNCLTNSFTAQTSIVTIEFDCKCGSDNCRGKIRA